MSVVPASHKKEWTEEELQSLPDSGFNYEVVDGELIMSPKDNYPSPLKSALRSQPAACWDSAAN